MANWTGSFSISAGQTGTVTSATANTLTNSSANFGASNALVNFMVRITGGTGAGQTNYISANSATQLTFGSNWATTPDNTSTYEVVLQFRNGDAVTGSVTMTSLITEIADNAVVTFNGNFTITFGGAATVRYGKTYSTFATFTALNYSTSNSFGSWGNLYFNVSSGASITFKWIKIQGAANGVFMPGMPAWGTGSSFGPIWVEGCSSQAVTGATTLDQNKTWTGIFATGNNTTGITYSSGASSFTEIFERVWFENNYTASLTLNSNASTWAIFRDSVNFDLQNTLYDNVGGPSKYAVIQDSYFERTRANDGAILLGNSGGAGTSNYWAKRNTIKSSRSVYGAGSSSLGVFASAFNDWINPIWTAFKAIMITNATSYSSATSDNDYISGTNGAVIQHIDHTASTTSTDSPQQYQNLTTARTNPKSVRNFPLTCDNVVVGSPADTSVTVTFDSANGVVAGQGSTNVNADSASGQTVLSVASTVGFDLQEMVEIGKGTPRYETARIASISAGVSITLQTNLAFTHTAVQADTVTKQLRHFGLPFIRYGTASGVYEMQTQVPDRSTWGPIFTGWQNTFNGQTVAWERAGHSVTIKDLNPATKYYIQCCAYNPLGEVLVSSETSFTTAASANYTDPGITNVRSGTGYKFAGANETGTLALPTAAQVQSGVTFDSGGSQTGTYKGAGFNTDPGIANVESGVAYEVLGVNLTGTYKGAGFNTDPGIANVAAGVSYEIVGQTLTGTRQTVTNIIGTGTLVGPGTQAAILKAENNG